MKIYSYTSIFVYIFYFALIGSEPIVAGRKGNEEIW